MNFHINNIKHSKDMIHRTQFRTQKYYKDCSKMLQLGLFKHFLVNIKRLVSTAQLAPAGRYHNYTMNVQETFLIIV